METSISISVDRVEFSYKEKKVLDQVSFEVKGGEIFGLTGPDGAGKTTLFRIIASLLIPEKGKVKIGNWDTVEDFRAIRSKCGYMPGRFSLYQDLTVKENLSFFADLFGSSIEKNYGLIEEIYRQLEPFNSRKAGKLSGGMKQKLSLCCALIHKPKVLILDEPTTGVDPISRKEFWDILKKLKNMGITIIVSTPYMDEASLCDEIAFLLGGRILTIDKPSGLIKDFPLKIYAIKGENNAALLKELRKDKQIRTCYSFGEFIHATSYTSYFPNIPGLKEIREIKPEIEDCFIEFMHR